MGGCECRPTLKPRADLNVNDLNDFDDLEHDDQSDGNGEEEPMTQPGGAQASAYAEGRSYQVKNMSRTRAQATSSFMTPLNRTLLLLRM